MRPRILLALVVGLVAVGAAWVSKAPPPSKPLDLGIYYWHSPFTVTPEQEASLVAMGVSTIYVRAGEFVRADGAYRVAARQRWSDSIPALDVVLVLRIADSVSRGFGDDDDVRRSAMAEGAQTALREAREAGVRVAGLQIDADCPTRLLHAYATRLRELRADLGGSDKAFSFSATALPTWLGSSKVRAVAEAVDFLVPQFYEGRPYRTLAELKPIGDLDAFPRGLRATERLGSNVRVAIPAYGHALLFDEHGAAVASYQGVGVGDALRHPSLTLKSAYGMGNDGRPSKRSAWSGEELAVLSAPKGRGPAYTVAYLLPTPLQTRLHLEALRSARPRNCEGVILYRFPEPGETTTLPLETLRAALSDEPLAPRVEGLIERNADGAARVTIENAGNAATFASPDAVRLLVELDAPGLLEVDAGEFDDAVAGVYDKALGSFTCTGLARARAVVFRRARLSPGDMVRTGWVTPAQKGVAVRAKWKVLLPGGFEALEGGVQPR